ncbi:DUF2334 domain-containing protein [Mesorhizobium sp.]|uniref:DUF2334 domain-containing protein n=1 Tax=Mesorhizobium sp. TaxID=1871066 RepID=UPI002580C4E4|nr:DUF2334 domain-containing protein [Mesorhizobium sp.]
MPKFVIRIDDVCPTMNMEAFTTVVSEMNELRIGSLLGVVPDNRDPNLIVSEPDPSFSTMIRRLVDNDWIVAQHGFTHVYDSQGSTILGLRPKSEFAGHPLDVQRERIRLGKALLTERGFATDIFMAPGHSFDFFTLEALRLEGFKYVTDGYGVYPYHFEGLVFVPQLFSNPLNFGVGVYTICLHLNSIDKRDLTKVLKFIRSRRNDIVSFYDAAAMVKDNFAVRIVRDMTKLGKQATRRAKPMRFWRR